MNANTLGMLLRYLWALLVVGHNWSSFSSIVSWPMTLDISLESLLWGVCLWEAALGMFLGESASWDLADISVNWGVCLWDLWSVSVPLRSMKCPYSLRSTGYFYSPEVCLCYLQIYQFLRSIALISTRYLSLEESASEIYWVSLFLMSMYLRSTGYLCSSPASYNLVGKCRLYLRQVSYLTSPVL